MTFRDVGSNTVFLTVRTMSVYFFVFLSSKRSKRRQFGLFVFQILVVRGLTSKGGTEELEATRCHYILSKKLANTKLTLDYLEKQRGRG